MKSLPVTIGKTTVNCFGCLSMLPVLIFMGIAFYVVINYSIGWFSGNSIGSHDNCPISRSWFVKRQARNSFSKELSPIVGRVDYSFSDVSFGGNVSQNRKIIIAQPNRGKIEVALPEIFYSKNRSSDFPIIFNYLEILTEQQTIQRILLIREEFSVSQSAYAIDLDSGVEVKNYQNQKFNKNEYLGSFFSYGNQVEYLSPESCPELGNTMLKIQ